MYDRDDAREASPPASPDDGALGPEAHIAHNHGDGCRAPRDNEEGEKGIGHNPLTHRMADPRGCSIFRAAKLDLRPARGACDPARAAVFGESASTDMRTRTSTDATNSTTISIMSTSLHTSTSVGGQTWLGLAWPGMASPNLTKPDLVKPGLACPAQPCPRLAEPSLV